MKATDTVLGGSIHELVEAVERLEEIKPLTTGRLQRELQIGYGRASAFMDLFESLGIVSVTEGRNGERALLISGRRAAVILMRYLCDTIDAAFGDADLTENGRVDGAPEEEPEEELCRPLLGHWDPCAPVLVVDDVEFDDSDTVEPPSSPSFNESEMLRRAVELACTRERIGTSALQRSLGLGYGRAALLIDRMETLGIVGPDLMDKKGRVVLLSLEEALARLDSES